MAGRKIVVFYVIFWLLRRNLSFKLCFFWGGGGFFALYSKGMFRQFRGVSSPLYRHWGSIQVPIVLGGWVGPRAGLDRCGKSRPTGFRSPDRPARRQSLYRLSYRAHWEESTASIFKAIAFQMDVEVTVGSKFWENPTLSELPEGGNALQCNGNEANEIILENCQTIEQIH